MDIKFQIPNADDFLTAILGIIVVMFALALIAVLILLISKIIRVVEGKAKKAQSKVPVAAAPAGIPMPEGMNNGEVDLVGVDEKTAAVIMAIVSQQSNIPLNRLSFKSIKLIDDGKKGGKA